MRRTGVPPECVRRTSHRWGRHTRSAGGSRTGGSPEGADGRPFRGARFRRSRMPEGPPASGIRGCPASQGRRMSEVGRCDPLGEAHRSHEAVGLRSDEPPPPVGSVRSPRRAAAARVVSARFPNRARRVRSPVRSSFRRVSWRRRTFSNARDLRLRGGSGERQVPPIVIDGGSRKVRMPWRRANSPSRPAAPPLRPR